MRRTHQRIDLHPSRRRGHSERAFSASALENVIVSIIYYLPGMRVSMLTCAKCANAANDQIVRVFKCQRLRVICLQYVDAHLCAPSSPNMPKRNRRLASSGYI